MTAARFITFDGPKGVGKTTLLEALTQTLRARGHKVVRLCERNNDPQRAAIMALVNTQARAPSMAVERRICQMLAESRAWISREVLPRQPAGSLVLMDRWYASDAAFRSGLPFADALALNREQNVRVPDLQVAVLASAEVSWQRALARRQGLRSTVLQGFAEHAASTLAFERAMRVLAQEARGVWLCRNEGTIAAAVDGLVARIEKDAVEGLEADFR